jgi:hypothetical protein
MLTSLGFEIAIRDINIGDEMTNDYGTLNIIEKFQCAHSPSTNPREFVCPDDLLNFHEKWDPMIDSAFSFLNKVTQPLENFLNGNQVKDIEDITKGTKQIPSILNNYFKG